MKINRSIEIAKRVEWNAVHRIPGHTLDSNPNGHHFVLEITLEGAVDAKSGMVIDLKLVKKILDEKIVANLDHSFLVWRKDGVMLDFFAKNPDLRHIVLDEVPTIENMLVWIRDLLDGAFSQFKNVRIKKLSLWESNTSYAAINVTN